VHYRTLLAHIGTCCTLVMLADAPCATVKLALFGAQAVHQFQSRAFLINEHIQHAVF